MIIIPAIDLIDGKCVRLTKGLYNTSKIYNEDPLKVAKNFQYNGVKRIHIVDLDAARGQGNNRKIIKEIQASVSCIVETGGGVRTDDDVKELIDCGITKIIAGTMLASDPDKVAGWISRYGKNFIAGIDALAGEVKVSGWEKKAGFSDSELAKAAAQMGIISIIYTNIAKDGTLSGPDVENTARIAKESGLPVILSGGMSSKKDFLHACRFEKEGIKGIITGKALYEEKIDLKEIITEFQDFSWTKMEW